MVKKMKVEIWSDVVCPFCYIGKRKFEIALEQFNEKDKVEIVWKSYQLMPDMVTMPDERVYPLLAKKYSISLEESKAMHRQVAQTADAVGLVYDFDKAIPANTLKAHQLLHFAKTQAKQDEAEESLFRAYFSEGRNIDDIPTLLEIGGSIGLDETALKEALDHKTYLDQVQADIYEAQQVGVRGVPFFVLDSKYAVSGAQDPKDFLATLEKAFTEWRKENPQSKLEVIDGEVCTPDGEC